MQLDRDNQFFKLAVDFILYTNQSFFLTGKAGTGKTTFLQYIKGHCHKNMAVVAPTGVAAINAGGATIHSFFQLPFQPYVPGNRRELLGVAGALDKHHLLGRMKITKERRDLWQKLELLIIDEISMVRADVLDAIDLILRTYRNQHSKPFGGIQLVCIGDLFQLPPVAKHEEWEVLRQVYASPYFFDAEVVKQLSLPCITLEKIYRQSDVQFIHILNQIRNNQLDEASIKSINQLYNPHASETIEAGYITLSTHNSIVDQINANQLQQLNTTTRTYKASISGDFFESAFPAEEDLVLKIGAQVMFLKNDTDRIKRYYNGKIGVVIDLQDDEVVIQCKTDEEPITLKRYTWKNIKYVYNDKQDKVEEEEIGSYAQFPLRLAWAITIHKSQGLTFDKVKLDVGQAFASGQVYVAFSRCKTWDGIQLLSKINQSSLQIDSHIVRFHQQQHTVSETYLQQAKIAYQQQVLGQLFQFDEQEQMVKKMTAIYQQHQSTVLGNATVWLQQLSTQLLQLNTVGNKFILQLNQLFQSQILPNLNQALKERLTKAAQYFIPLLQQLISTLQQHDIVTDNRTIAKQWDEELNQLNLSVHKQVYVLQYLADNEDISELHNHQTAYKPNVNRLTIYAAYQGNTGQPSDSNNLVSILKEVRNELAQLYDEEIFMVAQTKSILDMANYKPQSLHDLKKIHGFGKVKIHKYGQQFIDAIVHYCQTHQIASGMDRLEDKEPSKKETKKESSTKENKPEKKPTAQISFELFKQGNSMEQVAQQRNFTLSTIQGHLCQYIENGQLHITEVVLPQRLQTIQQALQQYADATGLKPIKEALGDEYSYGEIKLVYTWLKLQSQMQQ